MLSQHVPNSGQRIKSLVHFKSHDNVSNCARILVVAMSEGCEQAMSRLEELKCVLCSGNLAEAGKRRILHCSSNAITDVYKVFKLLVRPTFAPASDVSYVCRRPCFKTLQKLQNHATAINSLLGQLGSPMLSAWRLSTSAETQTVSCAEVQ